MECRWKWLIPSNRNFINLYRIKKKKNTTYSSFRSILWLLSFKIIHHNRKNENEKEKQTIQYKRAFLHKLISPMRTLDGCSAGSWWKPFNSGDPAFIGGWGWDWKSHNSIVRTSCRWIVSIVHIPRLKNSWIDSWLDCVTSFSWSIKSYTRGCWELC